MRIAQKVMIISLIACTALLAGCPFAAYIAGTLQRPKKVDAKCTLPKDSRVLVLVESKSGATESESIKRELTDEINRRLLAKNLVGSVIPHSRLLRLKMDSPNYNRLYVTQIGEKLDADIVVYVHIDKFVLKDNSTDVVWHGQIETSVKVVRTDTPNDPRIWPKDRIGGYPVKPVDRDPATSSSPTYAMRLTKVLAMEMADRVTKLFYRHELSGIDAYESKTDTANREIMH